MNALRIGAVALSFISLLLVLISLGTDYWVEVSGIHEGLWKSCIFSTCVEIGNGTAEFNSIRAFMLLGMIAGAVSFFGLCATFYQSKLGSFSLAMISAITSCIAGLCTMIAMSIYTAEIPSQYGWSFALGWTTFPLYLITSVLAYISKAVASE